MIVDPRAGSKELIAPLRALGVECEVGMLPAGDVEIMGYGLGGAVRYIGVEHKTIGDLASSMRDGRAAEQLRAMREYYNFTWLLVEGHWEVNAEGMIAIRKGTRWHELPGRIGIRELNGWIFTEVYKTGVMVAWTHNKRESAEWLRGLKMWWTAKDWEAHRSHLAVYTPEVEGVNPFEKVSRCQRAALAVMPGIGQLKAKRVAQHFKSVRRMVNGTEEEWRDIEGVGKVIAKKVVAAMDEEE